MFRKILVPIDLALAKIADASMRLLYVQFLMPSSYADFVPTNFGDQLRLATEQQITDVADQTEYPQEHVSTAVRFGSIYHEVLAEADDWGADLIVLCSHRPSMATYLLGSNAQSIVRHAKHSVLVVR